MTYKKSRMPYFAVEIEVSGTKRFSCACSTYEFMRVNLYSERQKTGNPGREIL